jgi:hypothetical protein
MSVRPAARRYVDLSEPKLWPLVVGVWGVEFLILLVSGDATWAEGLLIATALVGFAAAGADAAWWITEGFRTSRSLPRVVFVGVLGAALLAGAAAAITGALPLLLMDVVLASYGLASLIAALLVDRRRWLRWRLALIPDSVPADAFTTGASVRANPAASDPPPAPRAARGEYAYPASQELAPERPSFAVTEARGLSVDEVRADLRKRPGSEKVAERVERLIDRAIYDSHRESLGMATAASTLHAAFTGNPGTGKTTSAQLYAEALAAAGALSRGQLVAVTRKDVVAGYVGQTAPRVAAAIDAAIGGVLFIDEAPALVPHAGTDFGPEVLSTLLEAMERYRDDLAVVLAGYPAELDQLLDSDPGLRSRVARRVDFPDYEPPQLLDIAVYMLREADYDPDPVRMALAGAVGDIYRRRDRRTFGNARAVRQLLDVAIEEHAQRLKQSGGLRERTEQARLSPHDVQRATARYLTEHKAAA